MGSPSQDLPEAVVHGETHMQVQHGSWDTSLDKKVGLTSGAGETVLQVQDTPYHQARQTDLDPLNLHGERRQPTPTSCSLTNT